MRNAVVLCSTLAALTTAAGDWSSFESPKLYPVSVTHRIHGYVSFADGLIRFYWACTEVPSYVRPIRRNRAVEVRRLADDAILLRLRHAFPRSIKDHALVREKYSRRSGSSQATVRLIGARSTSVAVMAALLIFPLWVLGKARLRAARRPPGTCPHCAYDLTGNVSGICPECGSDVESIARGPDGVDASPV